MKLSEMKRKLLVIEPKAKSVTVEFKLWVDETMVYVHWWSEGNHFPKFIKSKLYTLKEFKELLK